MVDISIVIVNWNVEDYLRRCIESIYRGIHGVSFEIIVVDNASTDGSVEMLNAEFPKVTVIGNNKNVGFSKANNQAIRIAQGKYILLLNPDTVILDRAIIALYRFIESHPDVVAVGPMILNADGATIQYECARAIPSLWNEFCGLSELQFHLKKYPIFSYNTLDYWDHRDSRYMTLLSGACMFCRADTVRAINLFDEDYFLYADDVDFCFRLRQKGKIYYLADAKIIHYGGKSSRQVNEDLWLLRCESTRIFFRKNMGASYSSGYRFIIISSQIVKIVLVSISAINNPERPFGKIRENWAKCWELIVWGLKKDKKLFSG